MGLLNKHFWKFFAGLIALISIGFLTIYATDFYAKKQSAGEAKILESKSSRPAR